MGKPKFKKIRKSECSTETFILKKMQSVRIDYIHNPFPAADYLQDFNDKTNINTGLIRLKHYLGTFVQQRF